VLIPTSAADPHMSAICFIFLSLINRLCGNFFKKHHSLSKTILVEFLKKHSPHPHRGFINNRLDPKIKHFLTRQVTMPNAEWLQLEPIHSLKIGVQSLENITAYPKRL